MIKLENDAPLISNATLINFQLDADNIPFITETLAANLYANPLSFAREIPSNAIDAVNRAGKGQVVVSLNKISGSSSHIFSVKDTGTGMNPQEFIRFISFGASDKKNKAGELGYWGLGSKSPFAYTNTFLVVTIKDGVKYTYSLTKGTEGYQYTPPTEETTTDENGTTVFINILDKDVSALVDNMEKELRYMEGLIFQSNLNNFWGDKVTNLNNSKVFKFKNFQFNESETEPVFLLNGVRYRIDWSHFGQKIDVPLGINIPMDGTVFPTPSREGLKYTTESIQILKKCIKTAYDEFLDIVGRYLASKTTTFADFLKFSIELKRYSQVKVELLPELSITVSNKVVHQSGFSLEYTDETFTKDMPNFHFGNRLENIFDNHYVIGKYTSNKFTKTKSPFAGNYRRRGYGAQSTTLSGLFNYNTMLNSDNMLYLDIPLDRRTNSYYAYNDKTNKQLYLIEKVNRYDTQESYFKFYTNLEKELVTDEARAEHYQLYKKLEQMFEDAVLPKRYSDIKVPDGWKIPRIKSNPSVKNKEDITFFENQTRKTQTIDSLIQRLIGRTLVYGLTDETSFGQFAFAANSDYVFLFFAKTSVPKILKAIENSGEEIEVLTIQEFLQTDEVKDIAEKIYYTETYATRIATLYQYIRDNHKVANLFGLYNTTIKATIPFRLFDSINIGNVYPYYILRSIIDQNKEVWAKSDKHQQMEDWVNGFNVEKLNEASLLVNTYNPNSERGKELCKKDLTNYFPDLDESKLNDFLEEYFYC